GTPAAEAQAAKDASVDAFHLAALVSAALMAAGAAASGIGLRASSSSKTAAVRETEPIVGAG
ncbi:MAG TPA: hypothetical protein VFP22_00305, partial [Candidatus Limnocylindrales bacterium]|nr:hypothetical protein [Candidatus Limnocylindrales bacterium]